jgi:hypothetical protein
MDTITAFLVAIFAITIYLTALWIPILIEETHSRRKNK